MTFTYDSIHPELRFSGKVIKTVLPHFSTKVFRNCNKVMDSKINGFWLGTKSRMIQHTIPRKDGTKLRICIVMPKKRVRNVPGLLWIHGGGYSIGKPEQDFLYMDRFIESSNCIVVSPDYRLSDEAPYPAAVNDCYLALLWMKKNAEKLGIRSDQVFVGGESAGGGLTAAITLMARDRKEVSIAYQMPFYPMLDDRPTATSMNNESPVWNTQSNLCAWKKYLKDAYGTDQVSCYAAPARANDLSGLPPACTFIGTIDPFYQETLDYVKRLRDAGIHVDFKEFEGCYHAFDLMGFYTEVGKDAKAFYMKSFQYAVQHYFAKQPDTDELVN